MAIQIPLCPLEGMGDNSAMCRERAPQPHLHFPSKFVYEIILISRCCEEAF